MLLKTAIRILIDDRATSLFIGFAVGLSFFLVLFQWGLYEGYRKDTTVVLDAIDADLWIVPRGQPSFDGNTSIDDLAYWRAKSSGDVDAARIVWSYTSWRLPGRGSLDFVQLLGFEPADGVEIRLTSGGKRPDWDAVLRPTGCVMIGQKSRSQLEVGGVATQGAEINGRQVNVVGFVDDIHLFTTYGFAMTDLNNARSFLELPSSHISYVACKCHPGRDVGAVADRLRRMVPDHQVLTTQEFRELTYRFWQTKTGVGPILLMPAVLAASVGLIVVSLTFYIATLKRSSLHASLKAMGASSGELIALLGIQVFIIVLMGAAVGAVGVAIAVASLRETTISLLITPEMAVLTGVGVAVGAVMGVWLSARRVLSVDPAEAFD